MAGSPLYLAVSFGLIVFLSLALPSNTKKYDMESINEPVSYDGHKPPKPNDNFEYLTYKDDRYLFLSVNEKPLKIQTQDCLDMSVSYDWGEYWDALEVAQGFRKHPQEAREAALALLAKLQVKSIWEGTEEEEEGKGCKLYKLTDEASGKFVQEYRPCDENHVALCTLWGI